MNLTMLNQFMDLCARFTALKKEFDVLHERIFSAKKVVKSEDGKSTVTRTNYVSKKKRGRPAKTKTG